MHFRRSVLSLAVLLIGVNALPAPQATDTGDFSDTSTAVETSTTSKHGTKTSSNIVTTTSKDVQTTSDPSPVATDSTPTTTLDATTSSVIVSTTPVVVPITSSTSIVAPTTTKSSIQQPTIKPTQSTTAPTEPPSFTSGSPVSNSQTASAIATSSSSADAASKPTSGSNTKTVLIVGATVGGFVILAFIAFSIFRKLKLKPSRSFEERMEPGSNHLEDWNDPRSFRGYMPDNAPSLARSNSQASSKYSFDEADEKAGGGAAALARGNTIRHFPLEKGVPSEYGDGLREDGRGYRGF